MTILIAEIGINHNGDINIAKKLIDEASNAGFNTVKFQKRTIDKVYSKEDLDNEIQKIYDAVGWDKENMQYIEGYEQKPIEWIRIHNLADFAYYNHAQHVTVAGLDCQKCHGPVEEMEIMYQHSPLTMGWCIDCHRETNVDLENNDYYEKIHEELSKKYNVEKLTAAELGGLECGKCHY